MNKIIITFLISMVCMVSIQAQNDDKIKGDRNVTIKQTYIDPFHTIVVGEDFSVEIIYNKRPSVEVETDDNLHEYINFVVKDSILIFNTTKRITSSRRMNIKVNYDDALQHIEVRDDAEVRSLTSLEFKNATLKTSGTSKAYLNVKAQSFNFVSLDKAKVKLNVTAKSATIQLSDNSKLDALVNAPESKFDLYQRANADIEGTAENTVVRTENNSKFNGGNFTTKTCTAICETSSDLYIDVIETIAIEATGTSSIYLFGTPKITINKFIDNVKLQKKTK
ncbi:GIN domain-containing protein [Geojedonia litorea]|uniref:GIN domain-containing protein n=1 Tax=Geojedonia litorea TaxID=1268269 RepID=A0ABV9N333_9FLAO